MKTWTCPKCGTKHDNVAHLRRWKAEALPLLELLDRCHDLLPPDARADLGQSKAEAVENYLISARRWWR